VNRASHQAARDPATQGMVRCGVVGRGPARQCTARRGEALNVGDAGKSGVPDPSKMRTAFAVRTASANGGALQETQTMKALRGREGAEWRASRSCPTYTSARTRLPFRRPSTASRGSSSPAILAKAWWSRSRRDRAPTSGRNSPVVATTVRPC
jgi:hypothetical protein